MTEKEIIKGQNGASFGENRETEAPLNYGEKDEGDKNTRPILKPEGSRPK